MTKTATPDVDAIWAALKLADPRSHAARLLQLAAQRGIFDTVQASAVLGLRATSRDKHLGRVQGRGLIKPLAQDKKLRLGSGGKPRVYALLPLGVQICQRLGLQAHPYAQNNPHARRHDLYLVDLALKAREAGLSFNLETPIDYPDGQARPDLLITSPGGQQIVFELEGYNDWRQRARLIDKIVNWLCLVESQAHPHLAPRIRVLLMLTQEQELTLARRTWAGAIAAVQAETGGELPVSFWGRPILDFVDHPDWDGLEGFDRLDNPALAPDYSLALSAPRPAAAAPADPMPADPIPANLVSEYVPTQALQGPVMSQADSLRLRAIGRVLVRYLQDAPRQFSPAFFDTVREVYAISQMGDPIDLLGIPWGALLTLRAWIHHYPKLVQALQTAYKNYKSAKKSGVSIALQRASELIHHFLTFHNLNPDGPLLHAWVVRPGQWNGRSTMTVSVDIRLPKNPLDPSTPSPLTAGEPEIDPAALDDLRTQTRDALQWLLQQLLDQGSVLEIE